MSMIVLCLAMVVLSVRGSYELSVVACDIYKARSESGVPSARTVSLCKSIEQDLVVVKERRFGPLAALGVLALILQTVSAVRRCAASAANRTKTR
jgi:hypothetical protein